jgi:hypothetical protein
MQSPFNGFFNLSKKLNGSVPEHMELYIICIDTNYKWGGTDISPLEWKKTGMLCILIPDTRIR